MKPYQAIRIGIACLSLFLTLTANSNTADLLGWVPAKNANCCPLCGGYFKEPRSLLLFPTPLPYDQLPTHITAQGPTIFSQAGQSILQKNVRVTQPGRITESDKAYVYRDRKTGKITHVRLVGHVHMSEHGKLLVSNEATLNLNTHVAEIKKSAYRLYQENTYMGHYNAWGTANYIIRLPDGSIKLRHATFSTCAPVHPTWEIRASQLTINQKKKKAKAHNATVRLHNIPILWTPYLSFSTDNTRTSGLLAPLIQNSSNNGFTWSQPYYFNLAPNEDLTLDLTYMTKRGAQITGLYRYLTPTSNGKLYVNFLPNDDAFKQYKQDTFAQFPAPISSDFQPYITQLRETENYRGYFAYTNVSKFLSGWSSNIQLNYVTDPYYFEDFGATINAVNANQLLNQIDFQYTGLHWHFNTLLLDYQTLHPIDQATNPTVNQYMRLPELDASSDYPNIFGGVNLNMIMQAVNFMYYSIFPPTTNEMPAGQRFHFRPEMNRPFNWASGYFTPAIGIDSTTYNVSRTIPGLATESSRNIPYIDLDAGWYFNREFHWKQHNYYQTFEPRLFYLYAPFVNQDKYPNFDTQVLPFSYQQLFAVNRFTGFDRFQNADQLSIGLTSRVFDADDAFQRLRADMGIGYYIEDPKVCLTPGCAVNNEDFTPLVAQLTYYPATHWSTSGSIAWDVVYHQTNNAQVDINYAQDGRHIIGGGYTFVHAQPGSPPYSTLGFSSDSSLYNVHVAWPLMRHWSAVGYFYYNVSEKRPETYFAGLQYDACCWSLRFIVERTFLGMEPMNSGAELINQYNTNYIFQIQLKGIGSAGNRNPNDLLTNAIPGYHDPFKY